LIQQSLEGNLARTDAKNLTDNPRGYDQPGASVQNFPEQSAHLSVPALERDERARI